MSTKPSVPLERPPESMRPDRPEVMNFVGAGAALDLEPGVRFEALVGGHNHARGLTTGFVTFAPGASLPYHTHPFGESITLIRGTAEVEVEGRCHVLGALDNVVIPREVAHAARNPSGEPAVFHIALAADQPSRALVDPSFAKKVVPEGKADATAPERINRFRTAPRFEAGPNTAFIDFFNRDVMPGIEMSGGYGLFHPGGRLPAHVHDFDESICIFDGTATCIVEGRRYSLGDGATALVPRGRVHYFINESQSTMAMIWVYAGPLPLRIIVDERCATVEGNPWK